MSEGPVRDPHLVGCRCGLRTIIRLLRLLAILLNPKKLNSHPSGDINRDPLPQNCCTVDKLQDADDATLPLGRSETSSEDDSSKSDSDGRSDATLPLGPSETSSEGDSSKSDSDGTCNGNGFGPCGGKAGSHSTDESSAESLCDVADERPASYLTTVIRNMDTFDCFLKLANQAHPWVLGITEIRKPLDLLYHMIHHV